MEALTQPPVVAHEVLGRATATMMEVLGQLPWRPQQHHRRRGPGRRRRRKRWATWCLSRQSILSWRAAAAAGAEEVQAQAAMLEEALGCPLAEPIQALGWAAAAEVNCRAEAKCP
ncbi:UNVERIFIED_CONTAM: hypothetical protein K2H54_004665 [Gekko kuhli]